MIIEKTILKDWNCYKNVVRCNILERISYQNIKLAVQYMQYINRMLFLTENR